MRTIGAPDGGNHRLPYPDGDPMNLKELVDVVSQDTKISVGQVRPISLAPLIKWAKLIESQQYLASPVVAINSYTSSPVPASEGKPAIPARKHASLPT